MFNKIVSMLSILLLAGASLFAQNTKIIAHRGAWKNTNVPENSIAALQAAIQQNVWGTEFDVHLTKDDILVINHDPDFYGIDIATATYQELLEKKLPNGESIPTLEEYLREGSKQHQTKLVLELKSNKLGVERTVQAAALAVVAVKKAKAESHTVYISFSYPACLKIRELETTANIQYLNGNKTPEELKNDKLNGFDYSRNFLSKNPTYISEAKRIGIESNVWTVNQENDLRFYLDLNIDYITTDEPELLKKLLDKSNR